MNANTLTPAAAAKRAGVSRSAIMRAITSKELVALRDNKNRWRISYSDLDKWSENRPDQVRSVSNSDRTMTETVQVTSDELITARSEIAALNATIDGLEARLSDTQAERDRFASLLEKSLEPRPGFFERLLSLRR